MNINYYNPYAYTELYHHGIAGQRWGKRNGPPYPLVASSKSASEKKRKYSDGYDKPKEIKARKDIINSVLKKKIDSITPEQKAKGKAIAKKMGGVALYGAGWYLAVTNTFDAYSYGKKKPKAIAKMGAGYGLMIAG